MARKTGHEFQRTTITFRRLRAIVRKCVVRHETRRLIRVDRWRYHRDSVVSLSPLRVNEFRKTHMSGEKRTLNEEGRGLFHPRKSTTFFLLSLSFRRFNYQAH